MTDEFYVADTEYGQVRGAKIISEVGMPYWRFLGIPYAKPPVGELRFQKALKASPWDGILDTLKEPPPCAGKNSYIKKFVGSDDCLYLNVYTKNLKPEKKYPVMVYIHGGGFNSGSSTLYSYSPDYLLMNDIVIVIFNYRIGPLGFLSLKDKNLNVPGNAGIRDQQLALEFVRDNIDNFGGDPNNVTLIGHSSGAFCVGLHCLIESSKGLFHKAIMLGGSPCFTIAENLDWAQKLAVKLGFDEKIDDEKEILKFLEGVDVIEMAEKASEIIKFEELSKYGFLQPFLPTYEPYKTDSTIISENLIKGFDSAWSKDIDILIGANSDEGMYPYPFNMKSEFPFEIKKSIDEEKLDSLVARCEKLYTQKFHNEKEIKEKFVGDVFTWIGISRFIKSRVNSAKGKTFVHKFGVDSPTQNHYRIRWLGKDVRGVSHADELCYMWKNGQGDVPPIDSMEFRAIKKFTSIIANFIQNGNPGVEEWKPIDEHPPKGLTILPDESKFGPIDELERINEFWEKIFEEAGVKYC